MGEEGMSRGEIEEHIERTVLREMTRSRRWEQLETFLLIVAALFVVEVVIGLVEAVAS